MRRLSMIKGAPKLFFTLVAVAFLAIACETKVDPPAPLFDSTVLILNQGNFTEHSASLSLYDEVEGQIQNRIYEEANGISIGSTIVGGSVTMEGLALIICNNPDKIEFVNPETGKIVGSALSEGLENPRSAFASNDRIYVSNWGYETEQDQFGWYHYTSSYIAIFDRDSKELIKRVEVGTNAEGIMFTANFLFVATKEGVKAYDITNDKMTLVGTAAVEGDSDGAKHLVFDRNFKLWATFPSKGLVVIDPTNMTIDRVIDIPIDLMDGYLTTDLWGENIYSYYTEFNENYEPVESTIYKVESATGIATPFYKGTYFYGVGVSPSTGNLYTAETSFTSNSVMKVVSPAGELVASEVAGIATCRFLFF